MGGEAASFAVAAALSDFPSNGLSSSYLSGWNQAGYADIVVNSSYVGGAVEVGVVRAESSVQPDIRGVSLWCRARGLIGAFHKIKRSIGKSVVG